MCHLFIVIILQCQFNLRLIPGISSGLFRLTAGGEKADLALRIFLCSLPNVDGLILEARSLRDLIYNTFITS